MSALGFMNNRRPIHVVRTIYCFVVHSSCADNHGLHYCALVSFFYRKRKAVNFFNPANCTTWGSFMVSAKKGGQPCF